MRYPVAFALLLAACGSDDTPDALRGTCGDAGPGMDWLRQSGCVARCLPVNGAPRDICQPDGGPRYCITFDDPRNCGECGHDCLARECAPAGGIIYTATCSPTGCRCASP